MCKLSAIQLRWQSAAQLSYSSKVFRVVWWDLLQRLGELSRRGGVAGQGRPDWEWAEMKAADERGKRG